MNIRTQLPAQLALLAMLAVLTASPAVAEMVVVANAASGINRLSQDEVINIFLGRYRQLPSGLTAQPIDQPTDQPLKEQFYRKLVNKDLAEINAYWARLVFSGKTSPPRQTSSTTEVLNWLAHTPGAIGYIDRAMVDSRFTIIMEFRP